MAEAKASLAKSGEKEAVVEGDLSVTSKDLKADIEQLEDLHRD